MQCAELCDMIRFFCTMATVAANSFTLHFVSENLHSITKKIQEAHARSGRVDGLPLLVAVSKTKSVDMIIEAYNVGQRHFGENYVKELHEKSHDERIGQYCPEIKWHFIGNIQDSVNKLAQVMNLAVVETVSSEKQASKLNKRWSENLSDCIERLSVMVQVNTSEESQKNGLSPDDAISLANYIVDKCNALMFTGFMTIGSVENSQHVSDEHPNPDFILLRDLRLHYCKQRANVAPDSVGLSMGMSGDFEHAIQLGSTNVRVGSIIFGERNHNK